MRKQNDVRVLYNIVGGFICFVALFLIGRLDRSFKTGHSRYVSNNSSAGVYGS
jgi:hypothetical protein